MSDIGTIQKDGARERPPLVLPMSTNRMLLTSMGCALCVVGGISMLATRPVVGWLIIAGTGLAALATAAAALGRQMRLEVTEDGIAEFGPWRQSFSVSWREVVDIRTGWLDGESLEVRWNKRVFIDFQRGGRTTTVFVSPPVYGMNAEALAALLLPYLERARGRQNAAG